MKAYCLYYLVYSIYSSSTTSMKFLLSIFEIAFLLSIIGVAAYNLIEGSSVFVAKGIDVAQNYLGHLFATLKLFDLFIVSVKNEAKYPNYHRNLSHFLRLF